MKKILLILGLVTLFAFPLQAQDTDYYGSGRSNYSNNLQIAVGDSMTGEYYIFDQLIYLQVDSNWTASNIAVAVYNPYEETYELLYDEEGTLVEYTVVQGKTTGAIPVDMAGAKRVKFVKMTSGAYVLQATTASTIIVHTVRY